LFLLFLGNFVLSFGDYLPMYMRKQELYAPPQAEVMDFFPGQMLCASVGPGDFGTGDLPGFDFAADDN
jgi:hypothetical protein